MSQTYWYAVLTAFVVITVVILPAAAQPPTADASISKDRALRYITLKAGKNVATTPKRGFFGTIFNLILEQINDTKSAYNQISGLVDNQFDDSAVLPTFLILCLIELCYKSQVKDVKSNPSTTNGTADATKITRAEFLKILDRNLKGLARLRNLEWREARKDSWANLVNYKNEIFSGKKAKNGR